MCKLSSHSSKLSPVRLFEDDPLIQPSFGAVRHKRLHKQTLSHLLLEVQLDKVKDDLEKACNERDRAEKEAAQLKAELEQA